MVPKKCGLQRAIRPATIPAMDTRIADDARFALLAKVRQARRMSGEERILAGVRMFSGVCERMKEGLRDERPAVGEEEVHRLLLERLAKLRRLEHHRNNLP
jgi:hypothetical protein